MLGQRESAAERAKLIMQPKTRFTLTYLAITLLGIMIVNVVLSRRDPVRTIPYSQFQALVNEGKVESVTVTGDQIQGQLKQPQDGARRFVTLRVEDGLAAMLSQHDVKYGAAIDDRVLPTIIGWVAPVLVFFGLWMVLMRFMASRGGGGPGLLSIGKSKAKVYVEKDTKTTFGDVAGADEAKRELEEVVDFLKDPKQYGRLGARMPKGILLVGPPGTGKTLLARAVAGEAGVPFFSISGSEFVEMFVGVGAARVRDLFEQARAKAPAIIFIDELDALGRARGMAGLAGGHDEKEQTLNQLLVELDGFDSTSGIVLLAATNRPEVLDPALLRAGRFDRQILVDRPDKKGRLEVLAVHAKKVRLAPDTALEQVAALTPGFTGADLANLVNEAALAATRRRAELVTLADFNAGIERIVAGLERKNRLLSPREREVVAHHEMGHALVAAAIPGTDVVHKVSIIPRGIGALGYTIQRPTEDRYLMTREELEDKMAVLLAGRAAEELVFGQLSTGAADDITKATNIAHSMVTRYGMVPALGPLAFQQDSPGFLGPGEARPRGYSEETAREIDCAVRDIVVRARGRAMALLERNRVVLLEVAQHLLTKETLDEAELRPYFDRLDRTPVSALASAA
jgi:cell division protease FtsH